MKNDEEGNIVKNFIFYTSEGYTFQPDLENDMSDVENCQILGWGEGRTLKEAFSNFKKENIWLKNSNYNEITGAELMGEKVYYFRL